MKYRIYVFVSFAAASIHFFVETAWHFMFGQYLPMLIVDYIAIGLIFYACFESKKSELFSKALFIGAWGFTFCLFYRALFSRLAEDGDGVDILTLSYLGLYMAISCIFFVLGIIQVRKDVK